MSAPQIPNLLSLRGNRGGSRGGRSRGRGRSRGGVSSDQTPGQTQNQIVQETDTDAAVSRLSTVNFGYLQDPYASLFVQGPPASRLPIIRRGTYTRTTALDTLIHSFLQSGDASATPPRLRQIVSLGAGTDTRPLKLFDGSRNTKHIIYHEVDFEQTVLKKAHILQKHPAIQRSLPVATTSDDTLDTYHSRPLSGGEYHLHGVDLRNLSDADSSSTSTTTTLPSLRVDAPTLFLSECCLCYLSADESARVVDLFVSQIPNASLVLYEPIRPDDAFGQMMVSNLAQRGIQMPTLALYPQAQDQEARLRQAGFDRVKCQTIEDIWNRWVPSKEKERVDSLEGLDEVEEWKLLAGHYIVAWGSKGQGFESWDRVEGLNS